MYSSQFLLTKLLTLGILFSTAVYVVVVIKSVIWGILFFPSFSLILRQNLLFKFDMEQPQDVAFQLISQIFT